jgi:DNA-binding transcriptional ArsR family regulator
VETLTCYRLFTMNKREPVVRGGECCEEELAAAADTVWRDEDEELAALSKALGHPARVQIVRFLIEQGEARCICGDICEEIPLAQSTVSQHLKMLKEAGVIRGEVDGPRICYSINRSSLARLSALIAALESR